ncbi:MAG: GNAT family N-acetyltransferase [Chloroflexota bacterium]|nr:GNAT family N-acetyltransferase [Chloroflexota bacterium]
MEAIPELRTERLLLRPFHSGDVDHVFAYASNPEWSRYLPVPDPYTRRDAEEFVAGCILVDGEKRFEWAVVHDGRVSGGVSLTTRRPGVAELGYSIARPLWGQGLTTEAARAVIAHAFEELRLVRIQAFADIRNAASWRVMEKLGMERIGVAHRDRLVGGDRVDSVFYELLRDNWSPAEEQAPQQPADAALPELRTPRLLLRPFRMADVDDMFANASDPEWGRYIQVPVPYTPRDAEEFVARVVLTDPEDNLRWALVHDGRVAGNVDLTPGPEGVAELGFALARPLWGQGLVTEAATAVLAYGFESLSLVRVFAYAVSNNAASLRVMEKLGMKREGLLRRHRLIRGEYVDDIFCSILREEWSPPEPRG